MNKFILFLSRSRNSPLLNSDIQFNSLSRESTLEDSYYLDPITGQPILKPANKPPDYLHSPVNLHSETNVPNIYSPSSSHPVNLHPTSTVKTTGSLVNSTLTTVRSPRRQQPQVPRRRRSLERQVRLDEEDKFEQSSMSKQHLGTDTGINDDQTNRKDSYESYTTSLGDEEDQETDFFEDSIQNNWYQQKDQWNNNNNQFLNQQQQKIATRSLPQQPNKSNFYDQQQQQTIYQGQQFNQQQPNQLLIYDQQTQFNKENEQPLQQSTYMDLGPNEMQQQQLTSQTGQLAPAQTTLTQSQQLSPLIPKSPNELTDPQYIDQQRLDQSNKKEQWKQNKNETTFWQTVSEDENYDLYIEQHLQQQKQKQAFGAIQPVEEETTSYYDSPTSKTSNLDQSLDAINQNKNNIEVFDQKNQLSNQLTNQTNDQYEKREQWKNLPEQCSIWQTAESEDQQFETSTNQNNQLQDSSLAMLGGLTTKPLDTFDNEPITYDEQAENEKLFDQFDINKQKQQQSAVGQPPSALRNTQNLTGFSEPKTVTFSDQVQEESYDVISDGGSTTKSLEQKQIRTDPYTGQPIIDNSDLSYLDDSHEDDTSLSKQLTSSENELSEHSDYLGFEQPQKRLSLLDNDQIGTDHQLIGLNQEPPNDQHLSEQQSGLIEFAPSNSEGMTPARVRWVSAFNKIVAEMQEVS